MTDAEAKKLIERSRDSIGIAKRRMLKSRAYFAGQAYGAADALALLTPYYDKGVEWRLEEANKLRSEAKHVAGWGTEWGPYKNGKVMKRRTRRNPHSLEVAWTGKRASYVSPVGNYGTTGHSELAMHTGGAGKAVVRFALWKRPAKGWSGPADAVQWAQVEYPNGKILDGTPHEVLPPEVLRIIGRGNYGSPRMPRRKEKLQLWALSKGVAANRGKRRKGAVAKGKRVRKNVGHGHPVWQAGAVAHKFMSYLDPGHLSIWRDIPLVTVMHGGTPAKRAFARSVATVQERMKTLAVALKSIDGLRAYRTLLKTPLRAVAGAWGLMEVMRSDF
jgi:hypothetical protein